MTYGLWLSAAGLQINDYRQSIEANNLANADTVGFKHDLAVVRQRRVESQSAADGLRFKHPVLDGIGGGNWVQPTYHSFAQGDLRPTENPLDVAIEGNGFFAVSDGNTTRYTRDGRFTQNDAGELVMAAGDGRQRVLDIGGGPVALVPDGETPRITEDGRIRQGDLEVGQIGVFEFTDRNMLRKIGGNLFEATSGAKPVDPMQSKVRGGHVEESTVNPTEALAAMIEVSRAYEMNANLISLQDQTLGRLVNSVGRVA